MSQMVHSGEAGEVLPGATQEVAAATWSRRKKDDAPRGVRRHPSGEWAIRFTCGAGHLHKEKVNSLKTDAIEVYHARRMRARHEPSWCPEAERKAERERVRAERAIAARRVRFSEYADEFERWRKVHLPRSRKADQGKVAILTEKFGDRWLDEITSSDIERALDAIGTKRAPATRNRYRSFLSALFKRARREGHVASNPVQDVPRLTENNARLAFLTAAEEEAVLTALPAQYRPHFLASVHTGLRWSEQMGLTWRYVDFLTGFLTVPRSKHGGARRVPMNSVVRSVLVDLATARTRPDDPEELVFRPQPKQSDVFFPQAVQRAQAALREQGRDASRLDGYVWHSNRHSFASRLVMAGVDLRTLQELGGWKTASMVSRYAHLAPDHLAAAVERLVAGAPNGNGAVELARNYPGATSTANTHPPAVVGSER
jgi:site-specific recombinase XerD